MQMVNEGPSLAPRSIHSLISCSSIVTVRGRVLIHGGSSNSVILSPFLNSDLMMLQGSPGQNVKLQRSTFSSSSCLWRIWGAFFHQGEMARSRVARLPLHCPELRQGFLRKGETGTGNEAASGSICQNIALRLAPFTTRTLRQGTFSLAVPKNPFWDTAVWGRQGVKTRELPEQSRAGAGWGSMWSIGLLIKRMGCRFGE